MQDEGHWDEPVIDWREPFDPSRWDAATRASRQLIVTWPPSEFDTTPTDCFRSADDLWIVQPEVGAVRFSLVQPRLAAHPWPGGDEARFRQFVTRSWLPAIYPLWGRQVLHASAVVCPSTGAAVAFTGPTHAGKSTTAYGVSRRGAWIHASDDTVAFSLAAPAGPVRLHPIPNDARLRPESADYYGRTGAPAAPLEWPGGETTLRALYVLDGDAAQAETAVFTRLRAAELLPLLLQQAFALSFGLPAYNQRLMKDYLALASAVPAWRLRYRRSFDVAEALFAAVEAHLHDQLGLTCAAAPAQD